MLALDHLGIFSLAPEAVPPAASVAAEGSIARDETRASGPAVTFTVAALKGPLLSSAQASVAPNDLLRGSESPLVVPAPRSATERFAYVPHDMELSLSGDPDVQDEGEVLPVALESESKDFWTSETHREAIVRDKVPPIVRRAVGGSQSTAGALAFDSKSLDTRLAEISPAAGQRLREKFAEAKVAWPPEEVSLVAIKNEKVIELHARSAGQAWQFVHKYPVLAASGKSGPKLRKGDKQVPEGVYGISFLNPNSRYHVSLRVNYPNKFDRDMAKQDGRTELGGDIMIHGKNVSAGCLAIGDEAAEEIFVLAARIGLPNIKVIIAPTDFRKETPQVAEGQPKWLSGLYTEVASAMTPYKRPSTGLLSFFGN